MTEKEKGEPPGSPQMYIRILTLGVAGLGLEHRYFSDFVINF
jgi:hypothetical protein